MSCEHPSRRQFLTTAGTIATLGLTAEQASACFRRRLFTRTVYCPPEPCLRVRQNIASLSPQQISSLRKGVAAMIARPVSDPRSWRFQANIHGTVDAIVNPLFNQCEHGTLLFLAWHRGYLYYFERILRQAAGDPYLTLPYWNWTTSPSLPLAFRSPADPGNPLFDGTRAINDGSALPPDVVVDDLNTALNHIPFPPSGWVGFSRSLESSPHGAVHGLVSGNMGTVANAANDPIFWLHHCNIDRLWDHWLNLGGGRVNPSDSAFLDKTYSFADENGSTVTVKVRDILSSARLCYRYDNVPPPALYAARTPLVMAHTPDAPKPVRVASTVVEDKPPALDSKPLGLKPETVKLNLVPERDAPLKAAVKVARAAQPGKIILEIEGLAFAEVPNFTYGVYLNLPEAEIPEQQTRGHRVGTINFFGKGHAGKAPAGHAKDDAFTETFDVTAVVARLHQRGQWKPDALTVTLRPLTPVAPRGGEEALRKRSEESAQKAKVSYKRISLLVAP